MALSDLHGWNEKDAAVQTASACGASEPEEKPAACGSACGASEPEEKPAACGSACGAGDEK